MRKTMQKAQASMARLIPAVFRVGARGSVSDRTGWAGAAGTRGRSIYQRNVPGGEHGCLSAVVFPRRLQVR